MPTPLRCQAICQAGAASAEPAHAAVGPGLAATSGVLLRLRFRLIASAR